MAGSPPSSALGAGIIGNIGGIVQGVGGLVQARGEERMGEYNAALYERQAQSTRVSQTLLAEQKKKIISAQTGSQIAAAGASGFRFSGSPITVMLDSLSNANLDLAIDRYNSEVKARGFEGEAGMSRYEGRQRAARSRFGAASSFLSTASDVYMTQKKFKENL